MDEETVQRLREAIDLALVRLETFPTRGKDQLVSEAESLGREVDGWRNAPPSAAVEDAIGRRVASLHVILAKGTLRRGRSPRSGRGG